jgi:hypothetical protein
MLIKAFNLRITLIHHSRVLKFTILVCYIYCIICYYLKQCWGSGSGRIRTFLPDLDPDPEILTGSDDNHHDNIIFILFSVAEPERKEPCHYTVVEPEPLQDVALASKDSCHYNVIPLSCYHVIMIMLSCYHDNIIILSLYCNAFILS